MPVNFSLRRFLSVQKGNLIFSRIAQEWWSPAGPFQALHAVNPVRTGFILSRLRSFRGKKILDVGCGGGILSESMTQGGANVTGLDISNESLKAARQHAQLAKINIDYRLETLEDHVESRAGYYDAVTCLEVLEHVEDPQAMVKACSKVLKPGGDAFFSTLNRGIRCYLQAIIGGEYILGIIPKGSHKYRNLIKPSELERMAAQSGFEVNHTAGIYYNPLSRRARLGRSHKVNYIVHATKLSKE